MKNYICMTCGNQYTESEIPPAHCLICEDDRQYVGWEGQKWTTLEDLLNDHRNQIKIEEPNLIGIGASPEFAIGQRALLVQSKGGNILWDCLPVLDDALIKAIKDMGGISAIAISHPHFYATMVDWSRAFNNAPIYLHESNREWVMRPDPAIRFWNGNTQRLNEDITLIRTGGHFPGSTVLHWSSGADGQGVLLTGDSIYIASDRRYVSFMYSFPNLIPLPAFAIRKIVDAVEPFSFDRLYSGWFDKVVRSDAKAAVNSSAQRYIKAISDEGIQGVTY